VKVVTDTAKGKDDGTVFTRDDGVKMFQIKICRKKKRSKMVFCHKDKEIDPVTTMCSVTALVQKGKSMGIFRWSSTITIFISCYVCAAFHTFRNSGDQYLAVKGE
jgi:hypothetical protein